MFKEFTRLQNHSVAMKISQLHPGQLFAFHDDLQSGGAGYAGGSPLYMKVKKPNGSIVSDTDTFIVSLVGGEVVRSEDASVYPVTATVSWRVNK